MILKLLETVPMSSVTYRPTAVELVPNSPTPTGWRNKSRKAKKHKVSILILTWRTSYLQLRTVNNALDFKHFLREFVLNQQYSLNSFILKYRNDWYFVLHLKALCQSYLKIGRWHDAFKLLGYFYCFFNGTLFTNKMSIIMKMLLL